MPTSSHDFQKAALQRLTTAEFLLQKGYNLDAMYLAGYTLECAMKALILEFTPAADKARTLQSISSGGKMHNLQVLSELLEKLGCPVPLELRKKIRRSRWSTALRYESGRTDTGETRAFLKTAKSIYNWVESQLP